MDDGIIAIVVVAIAIFRTLGAAAKRKQAQQTQRPRQTQQTQQTQQSRQGGAGQPRPQPTRGGGWAEMLGIPTAQNSPSGMGDVIRRIEAAFGEQPEKPVPPAAPVSPGLNGQAQDMRLKAQEYSQLADSLRNDMGAEGVDACHDGLYDVPPMGDEQGADPCHEYMLEPSAFLLGQRRQAMPEYEPVPALRLDAPAIMQGVIFSEILTRPTQRGRQRAWQRH